MNSPPSPPPDDGELCTGGMGASCEAPGVERDGADGVVDAVGAGGAAVAGAWMSAAPGIMVIPLAIRAARAVADGPPPGPLVSVSRIDGMIANSGLKNPELGSPQLTRVWIVAAGRP